MQQPWNKGSTKETNSSVRKISETMKAKGLNNFSAWQKSQDKPIELVRNGDLAELIGMVLGDGSIHAYARTEGLRIVLPSKKPRMVERYALLVEKVFGKKPSVLPRKKAACFDIRLYQKGISERLGIPTGARKDMVHFVPEWIFQNRDFVILYLRGLFEAEGCICHHEATYTHKLIFTNLNLSLLEIVRTLLEGLGFHPHATKRDVQISRKQEVEDAVSLIQLGKY
jgi:intein/homing endonuclease